MTLEPSPCLPDVYSSMLIFILILDKMLKSIRGGGWNMKAPKMFYRPERLRSSR